MFKLSDKQLLSSLLTIAYCVFVLPLNERIAFTIPIDKRTIAYTYILKFAFAIVFFCLVYFVLTFIEKIAKNDADYRRWFKYSATYFAVMLPFLLLVYPGNWLWDEFNIFRTVQLYSTYSWQNYFTDLYYTFSLYLIPTAAAIVWFQLAIVSLVVGYVVNKCRIFFRNPKLSLWLFLPFFFLPIIYYNLYPLRMTIYSYLEVILFIRLLVLYYHPETIRNRYWSFIADALIITLLSFWRSEGFFYLFLLPWLAYKRELFRSKRHKSLVTYALVLPAILIVVLGYTVTKLTLSPSYQLSATLNPLSTMLQHPLKGSRIPQSLQSINKVVDLKFLKANPDNYEVPVLWYSNTIRPDYVQHISEYNKAAVYIISHNLGLYLNNRVILLLATNTFGQSIPQVGEGGLRIFSTEPTYVAIVDKFFATNRLTRPVAPNLKMHVTRLFLGVSANNNATWLAHIVWDFIPIFVLIFALSIWFLIRRKYFWGFLFILLLLRFAILFITSPADYIMYYLPIYMTGNLLVVFLILKGVDDKSRAIQWIRRFKDTLNKTRVKSFVSSK